MEISLIGSCILGLSFVCLLVIHEECCFDLKLGRSKLFLKPMPKIPALIIAKKQNKTMMIVGGGGGG